LVRNDVRGDLDKLREFIGFWVLTAKFDVNFLGFDHDEYRFKSLVNNRAHRVRIAKERMMNDSIVKGKWDEFKGEIQKLWGDVTGDDLEKTQGNVKAIGGMLEQKYGAKKESYMEKFNDLVKKYSSVAAEKSEELKMKVQNERNNSGNRN